MAIFNYEAIMEFAKKKINVSTISQEERDNIEELLNDIVDKYNKDSAIKKEILKLLGDYYDSGECDSGHKFSREQFVKFYPFICKLYKHTKENVEFEVREETQDYCKATCRITNRMASELNKKLGRSFYCDGGEGDEGRIYIEKR